MNEAINTIQGTRRPSPIKRFRCGMVRFKAYRLPFRLCTRRFTRKNLHATERGVNGPMHIGIQGELGSFSHEAALTFDPGAAVVPCMLSADAFRSLEDGKVDALAIPIENT